MSTNTSKTPRSPVVVVMGHVDHGKTTLLDYIRKSNVAAKEAGGITQGVGAYEVTRTKADSTRTSTDSPSRPLPSASSQGMSAITFIDTPGHEAFSKMRSRGALIADIAILVVAADNSVQPQTKEAIKIIQESKLPYVVAITKIDTKGANVEQVKKDLLQENVLLEGFGGDISFQPLSSKTGEGVNELLDHILLIAEVEGFSYDPASPAEGFILEAHLNNQTGVTTTVIIKNGTLKLGERIATDTAGGRIRSLQNFLGQNVKELTPSSPAIILGFDTLPKIGDRFTIGDAKAAAPKKRISGAPIFGQKSEKKMNFILKANVAGSLEALREAIMKLKPPGNAKLNIIEESVGDITDGDAKMALSTNAFLVAFKVKSNAAAKTLIKAHGVKIFDSEIIYELIDSIEKEISGENKKIVAGDLEILAVFDQKNPGKQIIGGKVLTGAIFNQSTIEVHRKGAEVGTGKIVNLQTGKKDVVQLDTPLEGGLLFSSQVLIAKGDHLIARPQ
ncbi:MAG: GTP-binding protein [bacterium]|nr:GTP-binding protein [bacterium]